MSNLKANTIPIVILGNSPITSLYSKKIDFLKKAGVIQGVYSLNPNPTKTNFISESPEKAFVTITSEQILEKMCKKLLQDKHYYFSSMMSKKRIRANYNYCCKRKR